ncbi:MAG: hydantoinase B/oxoprolinase family protein, partial [Thermoanaerobaculia bacterium]
YPWGILGGKPGRRSEKILQRKDGSEERLPSKCDEVHVEPGDVLIYRTAGGGGWKDPLERPIERVEADVAKGLVSAAKAKSDYGVIVGDAAATEELRASLIAERGGVKDFDMGPALDDILAQCEAETGLAPPVRQKPLAWAPMETAQEASDRVRQADRVAKQAE